MALAPSLARSSFLKLASARARASLDRASLALVANILSLVANRRDDYPRAPSINANRIDTYIGIDLKKGSPSTIPAGSRAKQIGAIHRENFLYLIRCGMIESVPSRRILSFS